MANVVSLRSDRKSVSAKPVRVSAAARRKARRVTLAGSAIGAVALTLTGLSLSHLADGISAVTHCGPIAAGAMAVGIDASLITLKSGTMVADDKLRKVISRYANPAIIGTLVASGAMNAAAFAGQASGNIELCAGIALGAAIPALIYVLTEVSAAMLIHR